MARQAIGIGTVANDGTGDPLRTAFDKTNQNMADIYTGLDIEAVSAALAAASYIDVAHFDNSKNPAWLDKTEDAAWYSALGRFPMRGFVSTEAAQPIVYDATGAAPVAWGQAPVGLGTITSVAINGHVIVIGSSTGIWTYDLMASQWKNYNATGSVTYSQSSFTALGTAGASVAGEAIVNATVNDVAIIYLDDAPLDAYGVQIPTIAAATDGGVSVVNDDLTVADSAVPSAIAFVAFDEGKNLQMALDASYQQRFVLYPLYETTGFGTSTSTTAQSGLSATSTRGLISSGANDFTMGFNTGLQRTVYDASGTANTGRILANITDVYATPYMQGDVELCLDGSSITDRSVTGTTVTDNGTAAFAAVNGGDLQYTTATGGTLTAPVTTGGEVYGWEQVGGVWLFRRAIADFVGISEAAGTLTIADATVFTRIVYVNGAAPTTEQLDHIEATDKPLFEASALMLLSNAAAVSALSHDASTDVLSVGNGTNVDQFKGLLLLSSAAHGVTTLTALASGSGDKTVVGTGGSFARPAQNLNSELKALQLELADADNAVQNYSFTSSGTTWALPQGFKASSTLFNVTDGTFAAVSQTFDGFIWTLDTLTTAKAHEVLIERV